MKKKLSPAQAHVVNLLLENPDWYIHANLDSYHSQTVLSPDAIPKPCAAIPGYKTHIQEYFWRPTLLVLIKKGIIKECDFEYRKYVLTQNYKPVKKWHRIFGWVTCARNGKAVLLVNSEYKHIQHYIMGKGWVDYIGTGPEGHLVDVALKTKDPENALFDEPQKDDTQAIYSGFIKWLK